MPIFTLTSQQTQDALYDIRKNYATTHCGASLLALNLALIIVLKHCIIWYNKLYKSISLQLIVY